MGQRQEVPKPVALLLIVATLGFAVALVRAGTLSPLQIPVMVLLLQFVVQPLSILLHECGHAVVARRVSSGPVSLIVGRGPYLSGTVGGVRMNFSLLPGRGVRVRGVCRYDPRGVSWRHRAAVSLAGPLATSMELLLVIALTLTLWPGASPLWRNVLLWTAVGLGSSVLVNVVPRAIIPGVLSTDGANALRALRNHRAGAPTGARSPAVRRMGLPTGAHTNSTPLPAPHPQQLTLMDDKDGQRARAVTSVPPPAPPS